MIAEDYSCQKGKIYRKARSGSHLGESYIETSEVISRNPAHIWWQEFLRGREIHTATTRALKIIDLFCGSGGLSLGAHLAANAVGLKPKHVLSADMDRDALKVYNENFSPSFSLNINVASLVDFHVFGRGEDAKMAYLPELLDPSLQSMIGKIDLLIAGPPCQGHSNLNNHTRRDDPRNLLYLAVTAIAVALSVKTLVIENVPDVDKDASDLVETATAILAQAGYFVSRGVAMATDLGGWQTRRRHFHIATLEPHIPFSEAVQALKKEPMNLWQVIGDLDNEDSTDFMDFKSVYSGENQARIDYLFLNDLYDLPNKERPNCHKNGHTYPSVYGRLYANKPAPTITTGFLSPGRGRYIHPTKKRVLTPREAARIQGFPDTYRFGKNEQIPSRSSLSKWIGDAVPSQLGYVAVMVALSGLKVDSLSK